MLGIGVSHCCWVKLEGIACLDEAWVDLLTFIQLNFWLIVVELWLIEALRCASYPLSCHTEGDVGSEFIVNQLV